MYPASNRKRRRVQRYHRLVRDEGLYLQRRQGRRYYCHRGSGGHAGRCRAVPFGDGREDLWARRRSDHDVSGGRGAFCWRDEKGSAQGYLRMYGRAGVLRIRIPQQGRAEAAGCDSGVYACPHGHSCYQGCGSGGQWDRKARFGWWALRRSGIQDYDGSLRGKAGVLPRVFRNHEFRFLCAECHQGQEGARGPYSADACKQACRAG